WTWNRPRGVRRPPRLEAGRPGRQSRCAPAAWSPGSSCRSQLAGAHRRGAPAEQLCRRPRWRTCVSRSFCALFLMQALDVFTHLLLPVYIRKSLLDDDGVIRDGTDHAVVRPDAGSGANRIAFSVRCLHHGVVAESPPHDSHQTELCDAHALERREVEVLLSQVLALQNDCGERVPPPRRIVGIAELSCIRSRW